MRSFARIQLVSILAFAAVAVTAGSAAAQSKDIVKLNQEGIAAFSEGRFADAAERFRDAYAISAEPPLKKNEALAWFKAERCGEALGAAKEYLTLGTDDELSNTEAKTIAVRCYIQRAEGEVAAGDSASAAATLSDAKANTPTAEDQAKIAELEAQVAMQQQAAERQRMMAEQAAAAKDSKASRNRTMSYGLMGGGGAIILGTLIYHVSLATGTSSKFREAAAAGDQERYDKLGKRLETGNWLVPTLYAVGAATAGVGAYFWWNGREVKATNTGAGRQFGEFGVGIAGHF